MAHAARVSILITRPKTASSVAVTFQRSTAAETVHARFQLNGLCLFLDLLVAEKKQWDRALA